MASFKTNSNGNGSNGKDKEYFDLFARQGTGKKPLTESFHRDTLLLMAKIEQNAMVVSGD